MPTHEAAVRPKLPWYFWAIGVLGLLWNGLGVVGGFIGSVLLLLRHRLAVAVLGGSLFGAVANTMVYVLVPAPPGFVNPILTTFIIGFAACLVWFAHAMTPKLSALGV